MFDTVLTTERINIRSKTDATERPFAEMESDGVIWGGAAKSSMSVTNTSYVGIARFIFAEKDRPNGTTLDTDYDANYAFVGLNENSQVGDAQYIGGIAGVGAGTNSGTLDYVVGVGGQANADGAGTIGRCSGVAGICNQTHASGTVTWLSCFYGLTGTVAGTVTHLSGVYLEDVVGGVNNWAIYSKAGRCRFGDRVIMKAPDSAIEDAGLFASSCSFYLNEAGNTLVVKAKYAGGTVKTGTIALT